MQDTLALIFSIFTALFKSMFRKLIPPSEKSVHGEVVLITGAGHGMGRLYSQQFAALGAKLVLVDINEATNKETAEIIKKSGISVHTYTCDLRSKENIRKLGENVRKEVGDVDILVNNAGVLFVGDILSLSEDMISTTFDVNIVSHFWLIREFLPAMKKKNHGHILAMSSYSAREPAPYLVDYAASKLAVVGLMEGLRRELRWLGLSGIKTTYVCPVFVNTGFAKNPVTKSSFLCPILEPEFVVDKAMHGFLTDQPFINVPDLGYFATLLEAILPSEVRELVFDYVQPRCDHTGIKTVKSD